MQTRRFLALLTVVAIAPALRAQPASFPPSFEVRVPKAPTVMHGGGQTILPYELHITNFTNQPITLQKIEVFSADAVGGGPTLASSSSPLLILTDSALIRSLARPGMRVTPGERVHIAPGLRAVAYMWVPVSGAAPKAIRHRLTATADTGSAGPLVLETAPVPVNSDLVVITPPLKGSGWLAANGPSAMSGHRRAMIPLSGSFYIAQRFAIDWVKLDARNKTFTGDSLRNSSYYAYGNNALAVADGIVTEVKDSIPENVPGLNSRAVPITLETVGGNHVIIDIGGGRYAFYAHLQPHSIRVKLGDKVKRGQVLGLVGNSGNSTEPHLHFHMSDASSPLGSEGIPYAFETLYVIGRCQSLGETCTMSPTPTVRRLSMPVENEIVRFP
jgi:biotin carboxyl carrier protein